VITGQENKKKNSKIRRVAGATNSVKFPSTIKQVALKVGGKVVVVKKKIVVLIFPTSPIGGNEKKTTGALLVLFDPFAQNGKVNSVALIAFSVFILFLISQMIIFKMCKYFNYLVIFYLL
jgi:hypothetical protein